MTAIKVEGVGRLDGLYDLGEQDRVFNGREWHLIKTISGYMPGTVAEGFAGEDPDLFVAFAVIAMCRNGKVDRDRAELAAAELLEAPYTSQTITVILDEEENEIPPAQESENEESLPNDSLSSNGTKTQNENSSGLTSKTGSAQSDGTPAATTA